MRRKMIRTNPCRDVKPPRLRPKDNVYLTVEQVQALAKQLPPPLDLLVLTAAGSGLRAGELNGLRVRDIELLRRRINVRQTVTDLGSELIVDTPKSNAGRHTVPISPALCDLLASTSAAPVCRWTTSCSATTASRGDTTRSTYRCSSPR